MTQTPKMVSELPVLKRRAMIRNLSIVLAIGGVFWSLFCAGLIAIGQVERTLPIFGPGYVITLGYIMRALIKNPSETLIRLRFIRSMWLVSAIIQAAWLIPIGFAVFTHAQEWTLRSPGILAMMIWWIFATLVSLYGWLYEPCDNFEE